MAPGCVNLLPGRGLPRGLRPWPGSREPHLARPWARVGEPAAGHSACVSVVVASILKNSSPCSSVKPYPTWTWFSAFPGLLIQCRSGPGSGTAGPGPARGQAGAGPAPSPVGVFVWRLSKRRASPVHPSPQWAGPGGHRLTALTLRLKCQNCSM